ncbi:hypothetical protein [Chitinophaga sp. LS1]|uniref:hypothetical protein n=1 Tax=Chitinophaga sp. LS1 TaxID=3051176 RepID=UPI002AAAAF37|nr:hypothetical protein [Chitinophaga sp. LS1]WPV68271.1 hypothetical protein QQL36_06025 [Chitinophaga sp. LS1]
MAVQNVVRQQAAPYAPATFAAVSMASVEIRLGIVMQIVIIYVVNQVVNVQQAEECPVLVQQLPVLQLEVISTNAWLKLTIQLA